MAVKKLRLDDSLTHIGCILYPDAKNYNCAEVIEKWCNYFSEWAYILHDNDLDTDGTKKKPHYMIYGKHTTNFLVQTVINQTGAPFVHMQRVSSQKGFIQYFCHFSKRDQDKFQYSVEKIHANFDVSHYFVDVPEMLQVQMLYAFVTSDKCVGMSSLVDFALKNKCWSELRRGASIWRELLREPLSTKNKKGDT